jgi:hypothetical protein
MDALVTVLTDGQPVAGYEQSLAVTGIGVMDLAGSGLFAYLAERVGSEKLAP